MGNNHTQETATLKEKAAQCLDILRSQRYLIIRSYIGINIKESLGNSTGTAKHRKESNFTVFILK